MAPQIVDCTSYRTQLDELILALPKVPRADLYLFLEMARKQSDKLPAELASRIDEFNANGNLAGYLLLRGTPVEQDSDLPPTPTSTPPPPDRPLLNMEAILCIIGSRLGLLSAYDQGYGNRRASTVIHDLYPTKNAHPLSAETTEIQLEFHSDLSHHARQPNYIVLACSRADHERKAATVIASIRRAMPLLSDQVKNLLFERMFTRLVEGGSGETTRSSSDFANFRVFHGDKEDPFLCYDRSFLTADDPADREAIAALSRALDEVAEEVRLAPGDLLIIDNFHTTHARTPFTGQWDGRDRWLNRAYVRTNRNGQLSDGDRAGDIVAFVPRR